MNKYIILLFLLVAVSTEEIPVEGNESRKNVSTIKKLLKNIVGEDIYNLF